MTVAKVHNVGYVQYVAPCATTSVSVKTLTAVANEFDYEIHRFDCAEAYVRAELDNETYMELTDGCGDLSGKGRS